ncbi:MAG: hypothetical protein E7312_00210 [Clostridiales bacterium]|nr:hypothetical protein [Clostridiales bacterium]
MINKWINDYKKTPAFTAMTTTIIFGLIVHLFVLTNSIHNYDDIAVQPAGVGTSLPSGRWFLYILKRIGDDTTGNFNLPWVNGLVFLLLISLTVAFLVSAFGIKNKLFASIIGAGLVSFPSITVVLFFKYTAPHYGLAILLGVIAVWVTDRWRYGFSISTVLIALTLGIYQAYFPWVVSIYLILLIKKAVEKETKAKNIIKKGFVYLGTMCVGLIEYFVVLKVMLKNTNTTLLDYQGISNMGKLPLSELPTLVFKAVKEFVLLPVKDYCSLATSPILRLSYLTLALISLTMIIILLKKNKKKPLDIIITITLCVLLPLAINLIVLMGAAQVYTLMVLPFSLLLFVPIVLWDVPQKEKAFGKGTKVFSAISIGILAVIIFFNSYFANINYSSMYFTNRQVENTMNSIITQIHMADGYTTDKRWAFVGTTDSTYFNQRPWGEKHLYGGQTDVATMLNQYSKIYWVYHYLGHRPIKIDGEELNLVGQLPEVVQMPVWPNNGSVKVIDEYVVIKLGE